MAETRGPGAQQPVNRARTQTDHLAQAFGGLAGGCRQGHRAAKAEEQPNQHAHRRGLADTRSAGQYETAQRRRLDSLALLVRKRLAALILRQPCLHCRRVQADSARHQPAHVGSQRFLCPHEGAQTEAEVVSVRDAVVRSALLPGVVARRPA